VTIDHNLFIFGEFKYEFEHQAPQPDPQRVVFFRNNVKSVSSGEFHAIVLTINGDVYAFGRSPGGLLGLGHNLDVIEPEKLETVENIISISCGDHHTAAIDQDGNVYTFGDGRLGQLGHPQGTTYDEYGYEQSIPKKIAALNGSKSVSCGAHHTAVVTAESDQIYQMFQ
jgi:alpha-tubulin suppressor-like RCC1 family protein